MKIWIDLFRFKKNKFYFFLKSNPYHTLLNCIVWINKTIFNLVLLTFIKKKKKERPHKPHEGQNVQKFCSQFNVQCFVISDNGMSKVIHSQFMNLICRGDQRDNIH